MTREAEQRLAAALERIADMADQGLSRTPAAAAERAPAPSTSAPPVAEVVERLDALIERLRDALGQ